MITLDSLQGLRNIRHGFLTREGGVSEGLYTSLNCGFGSGDQHDRVAENRARAAKRVGADPTMLVSAYQIHSPTVAVVDTPWSQEDAPQADALVANRPGIALGILTADCVPVLFADPGTGVIGAAHAGWKGTLVGVLEATLDAMIALGAETANIRAAIGPAIQQNSYEVGAEFPAPFLAQDPTSADYFVSAPRQGHFLLDLPGYVEARLRRRGITALSRSPLDTLREEARFFSYRRTCLRGERDYGRGLSIISLSP